MLRMLIRLARWVKGTFSEFTGLALKITRIFLLYTENYANFQCNKTNRGKYEFITTTI